MRIGIDIRALMEGKITGVQVYITNLLHALFRIDQKNQYFLFANSFRDIDQQTKIFNYPNVHYTILSYPNKLFNIAQKFLRLPKIDKTLGGLDLFFSPHWRTAALSSDLPLIVTFHDLAFEILPEFFTLRQRLWHKFMDYRTAARKATKIVAVSKNTKADLIRLYKIPAEKITVIYPGVNFQKIVTRPNFPVELPPKYFLSFSTFEPRKNLEAVIVAYQEYLKLSRKQFPLVLAGSSGWKTQLEIPPEISPFVTVLKNVSEEQKSYLHQNAYALLFLSFYEGFGFPVLEAAADGVPVISSFGSSLSEIATSFALFVNPFRSVQIAQTMLELERDPNLYQELKKRGLRAVEKYTWKRTAEEMLELFKSLMSFRP